MIADKHLILVVEDGPTTRLLMSLSLKKAGYLVDTANNGNDAIKRLRLPTTNPDCIVLDMLMPVMDGWEFLKQKSQDPELVKIPVIVLTYSEEKAVQEVWQYPCVRQILSKDCQVEDLLGALTAVLAPSG